MVLFLSTLAVLLIFVVYCCIADVLEMRRAPVLPPAIPFKERAALLLLPHHRSPQDMHPHRSLPLPYDLCDLCDVEELTQITAEVPVVPRELVVRVEVVQQDVTPTLEHLAVQYDEQFGCGKRSEWFVFGTDSDGVWRPERTTVEDALVALYCLMDMTPAQYLSLSPLYWRSPYGYAPAADLPGYDGYDASEQSERGDEGQEGTSNASIY